MNSDYKYILKCIRTCNSIDFLESLKLMVEVFYFKYKKQDTNLVLYQNLLGEILLKYN